MRQLLLLLLLLLLPSCVLISKAGTVVARAAPNSLDHIDRLFDVNGTDVCYPPTPPLEKFAQLLTFPPTIDVSLAGIILGAYKVSQNVHPDLPNTTFYAFGTSQETATFPGPTLLARRYVAAHVRWENHILDENHLLPQAGFVEWANPSQGGVPVVVHLHGAEVASVYDGHPDAWITSKNETGPTFFTQDYVYANEQPATALWYHDHTYGITRLNVLAGLAGMYIIRPTANEEEMLGLPDGAPLTLKDMRFNSSGSLMLPGPQDVPSWWCPEDFDVWLVNGRVWPYVHVYAKPYRFHLLNACNKRLAKLFFNESMSIPFWQIGTDGGLLPDPVLVDPYLVFSPGERADVIIDFSGIAPNSELVLQNANETSALSTSVYNAPGILVVMKFIIVEQNGLLQGLIDNDTTDDYFDKLTAHMHRSMDTSSHQLASILRQQQVSHPEVIEDWQVDVVRELPMVSYLNASDGRVSEFTITLDKRWHDPIDIMVSVGSYEVWEIMNLDPETGYHNFHVHLVDFQVVNQQSIDGDSYLANNCSLKIPYPQNGSCFTDYPQSPFSFQQGWKDTSLVYGQSLIRLLIHFKPREKDFFTFDATQGPGYVLHCHIVQHEDHSVLRPYVLISNNQTII